MIVKNEIANLERCLESVAPYVSCYVIGDTGSTDGTQEFIRSFFAKRKIPGEVHEFPFVNFEQARNEALARARASTLDFDYILLTDADMELRVDDPAFRERLTAAAYRLLQKSGVAYWNLRLLARTASAIYRGVTHEYLDIQVGDTLNLDGAWFVDHATGSNRVEKYERDIRLITEAIDAEKDPGLAARYRFYLANTYRDAGHKADALRAYEERSRLGNWQEEVFVSLLNAANLRAELDYPDEDVIAAYERAAEAAPWRAEAPHDAARFCRGKALYEKAYNFAAKGLGIAYPNDGLFVHDWVYDYGLLDELAVAAYWTGRYEECLEACDRLLAQGKLPPPQRERVEENRRHALARIEEGEIGGADNCYARLLRAARAKEELRADQAEVIAAYETAAAANSAAAEPLHGAARYCRGQQLYDQAYAFALRGLNIPHPDNASAAEAWIYDYGLLDEFAIAAYWTGHYAESEAACQRLLTEGNIPDNQRNRIERNLAFANEKRAERERLEAAGDDLFVKLLLKARQLDESGAPQEMVLSAYDAAAAANPSRAEALHGAARWCRRHGLNELAVNYALRGLMLSKPMGAPALEDWIYDWGLAEELSIAANYASDATIKSEGFAACDWLALSRDVPVEKRELAHHNLHFYLLRAEELMPSFSAKPVRFDAPPGYHATNPSVARFGDSLVLVQRTVNYAIHPEYPFSDPRRYSTIDGGSVHTRNFYLKLNCEPEPEPKAVEIIGPADLPEPAWSHVLGFEDLRPFVWRGELWGISCVRELNPEGWCEMMLARIALSRGKASLTDWRVLQPEGQRRHEKNWMPLVEGDELRLVYSSDPTRILDQEGHLVAETEPPIYADTFRGGTQFARFDGGWLAIVHEMRERDGQRNYRHRFIWFDRSLALRRISHPFIFREFGIEFAAGLAWAPGDDRLVISFGVRDNEAWIASVEPADVQAVLHDAGGPFALRATSTASSLKALDESPIASAEPTSTKDLFLRIAPFLERAASPLERRDASREFDARIAKLLDFKGAALPQIHCFYEASTTHGRHPALVAAIASMRAAGHPVKLWTYTPERLECARDLGAELCSAADVIPRGLYERIVARSEIRYFSDVFRYAVLYEHGGLWMDTDVVMVRPFPFRGDYFFNLQWNCGARAEHFVCGNVIFARPHSAHMRALYERSLDLALGGQEWLFGEVGPKLLSDYIASAEGAELRRFVFSPVFFNPIDWIEMEAFDRPLRELSDHLADERVFGVHLWTARNVPEGRPDDALVSVLFNPLDRLPSFTQLAEQFKTDKNRRVGNRHFYARVYERLLSHRRLSLNALMEIGLSRYGKDDQLQTTSVGLWQEFFPFAHVTGVDLVDFSDFENERFRSFTADQSNVDALGEVRRALKDGSFDVIVDDGSHASYDEQLTLREFWPLLAPGGWYFIEDLDWQPAGENPAKIALTKHLLSDIQLRGRAGAVLDPFGIKNIAPEIQDILFFESHYELERAGLMRGLVGIKKIGGSGLVS